MATQLNTGRIAKNTLLLYVRMFVTMLIALITSRVVLNTLGVEDYGIYNIVGSVVVIFAFISSPVSTSLQRFLNVEKGRGDNESVRKTFNSSFVAFLLIVGVVVLLTETVGLWAFYNKVNIPVERFGVAAYVFHISLLTFCLSILKSPFEATILANEKMNAYAYFSIFDALIKLGFVFLLSQTSIDKLLFYAIGLCTISLLTTLLYALYCRVKFPEVKLSVRYFNKSIFKSVLSFSGWSTFGSFVYSGLTAGFNFIINYFFGVTVNAAVGIKNQVVSAIYSFVANFQVAFKPQLFQLYGAEQKQDFYRLIFFSSKLSFFLYCLLVFPLFPIIPAVLQLWLGQVPEYSVDLVRIGLLFNLIAACDGPLWMCVYATGKIKRYQIIINSIELCNIPLVIVLCMWGLSPQGVYITRIAVELVVFFVRWWYLKKYIAFPLPDYINRVFMPLLFVLIPLLISSVILSKLDSTLACCLFVFFAQLMFSTVLILFVGLNREERIKVRKIILERVPLLARFRG